MTKMTVDAAKDAKLQYLKDNCDLLVLCLGEPTSYANLQIDSGTGSGQRCAEVALVAADMTISDGPTDGRQLTIAQKSGVTPAVDSSPDYIAWLDTTNSVILHYSDMSAVAITTATPIVIEAHSYIDRDTTAVA